MPSGKAGLIHRLHELRARRCEPWAQRREPWAETREPWARKASRGFTLIELMIVMAIIVILVAVAVPFYQKSITRAKESVLRNNLFAMRSAIDEYTYDKQKAPQNLQELVTEGYLRDVPKDPITGRNDSWKIIMEDAGQSVNQAEPGIFDVRSGSEAKGLDGTAYSEW